MAFSTKIKGNHHLQGNVQVYNVRIIQARPPPPPVFFDSMRQVRPKKTIMFVCFAAEEPGLLGSAEPIGGGWEWGGGEGRGGLEGGGRGWRGGGGWTLGRLKGWGFQRVGFERVGRVGFLGCALQIE